MLNFEFEMRDIGKIFVLVMFFVLSKETQAQKIAMPVMDSLGVKDTTMIKQGYILYSGLNPTMQLEEVKIIPKLELEDENAKKYYYWFRRRVLRAYPYAKLASEHLNKINDSLAKITNKRQRKKYIKKTQKFMEEEFTPQLKKLYTTEGKVLIKLIYRQTGNTTFEVVKEYRSGWRAFWYNTTAGIFSLSLKYEYHPESDLEDYMIEDILQRADNLGLIDLLPTKLDFDYYQIPVPEGFGHVVPDPKKRK
ncbi:MAG: DUF4294 domain-containing protein [Flavobacteriaceae bacterium]